MPVFVVAPVPPPALPVCVVGIAVVVVAAPVLGVDAGPDGAYLAQNVVSSVQPPVFPVCIGVVVEGFSEAQVPVVGSNCESPVHLVPVLPPVFPVFICVVVVVFPVFSVCIGVVDWFFGTHLPTELSIKSSGHVC
jgi:hypothetical protein